MTESRPGARSLFRVPVVTSGMAVVVGVCVMAGWLFRIPGLAMTVVQADGQNVRPVTVDE